MRQRTQERARGTRERGSVCPPGRDHQYCGHTQTDRTGQVLYWWSQNPVWCQLPPSVATFNAHLHKSQHKNKSVGEGSYSGCHQQTVKCHYYVITVLSQCYYSVGFTIGSLDLSRSKLPSLRPDAVKLLQDERSRPTSSTTTIQSSECKCINLPITCADQS